jgi:hypothetical protein
MPITERDTCGNNLGNAESKGLEGHSGVLSDRDQSRRLHTQQDGQTVRPGSCDLADAESIRRGGWTDNEDGWWRQLASPNSCARSDVANADKSIYSEERQQRSGEQLRVGENEGNSNDLNMADASFGANIGSKPQPDIGTVEEINGCGNAGFWDNAVWLNGADGKTRRAKPGVRLLAHGVPARVGKLRAYGNAIVPPLAAEVIRAFMESQ